MLGSASFGGVILADSGNATALSIAANACGSTGVDLSRTLTVLCVFFLFVPPIGRKILEKSAVTVGSAYRP